MGASRRPQGLCGSPLARWSESQPLCWCFAQLPAVALSVGQTVASHVFRSHLHDSGTLRRERVPYANRGLDSASKSFYNIEALQERGTVNQPNYTAVLEVEYRIKSTNGHSFSPACNTSSSPTERAPLRTPGSGFRNWHSVLICLRRSEKPSPGLSLPGSFIAAPDP
jgi:hypothetical protein